MASSGPRPFGEDARPVISPHCRVITIPPREILIVGDDSEVRLTGELFCDLAPHLDGTRTIAEITERMVADGTATAEEVPQAVAIMRDRGYVVDARTMANPESLFRLWRGVSAAEEFDARQAGGVEIVGLGDVPVEQIGSAMSDHGISVHRRPDSAATEHAGELTVVVVDDLLHPDLAGMCEQARAQGRPVLVVCPVGPRPTIGPWLADTGPCYACLASRLRFNRQVEAQALTDGDRMGPVVRGWTAATIAHTGAEVALMIERWQLGGEGTEGIAAHPRRMLVIDHMNGERSWHTVVRRPQCPTCGTAPSVDDPMHVVRLEAVPLTAEAGRSYRRIPPAAVAEAYGHHVSPRTGIVERLERATDSESIVHVVESGVNLAMVRKGGQSTGFRQSASGKGITADQALAGGLAEAIERYSNTWHGDEPTIVGSLEELRAQGLVVIDPRTMQLFSERQYRERRAKLFPSLGPYMVPEEFDPTVRMDYSPAWSLTTDSRVWVPTAEAFYGYAGGLPRNGCLAHSNGCAAGTTIEDAILQGFFELVERDAVALWWYNRIPRPGVDLDAYRREFDEPYLDDIRTHYGHALDRDLWVLDVTSDLGIPAFVACSKARQGRPRVLMGFGAHRDPLGALLRAITEMNQMLAMIPALENRDLTTPVGEPAEPGHVWWSREHLDDDLHVLPHGAPTEPDVHRHDWGMDGGANVERAVALVGALGMDMHVLNATRPDVGLPVVKVMVPGLRHFWRRLAPGRLYDVPVQLGWRDEPNKEEAMNPLPMFW